MFRAISCSSSVGQIVSIQHLISSLSVSDLRCTGWERTFWTCAPDGASYYITLANDQLDTQIFNTFITILYMFRAISCSSSVGKIVLIQHLVSSLSVSDLRCTGWERTFSTCAPDGHFLTVTLPDAVLIQFDLLSMSKILLETCRGL